MGVKSTASTMVGSLAWVEPATWAVISCSAVLVVDR
jgi:hypothetical protein